MKKILFTLALIFSLHSFWQNEIPSFSNPVAEVIFLLGDDHLGEENSFVVPDNQFMVMTSYSGNWRSYVQGTTQVEIEDNRRVVPAGAYVWLNASIINSDRYLKATLHNYNTESSFSSNNVEFPNEIKLFPNPTTSQVALNSDKNYQIEVFDLLGNKVMEFKGNTINMEHLSRATYIVNAIDLETQESLSYKIIKKWNYFRC